VGGFGGKADRLNEYHVFTGDAGFADADLARYRRVTVSALADAARAQLVGRRGVALSVVPHGRRDLAADEAAA
jgi:hypothetical protein